MVEMIGISQIALFNNKTTPQGSSNDDLAEKIKEGAKLELFNIGVRSKSQL
jgi:hypothetical protein